MKEFTITSVEEGQRFDKYLIKLLPEAGKSFIYKMLRKNKSITVSGSSIVTLPDGTEKVVASYSGSINSDDSYNISKYVADNTLYNQNFTMCRDDYNEFEDYARTFLDNIKSGTDEISESESLSTSESESYSESTSESESNNTTN